MQKLVRKIVVYLLSLAVVAAVVGTVFFFYNRNQQKQREQFIEEENATKTTAKVALTEEEIEELLKEHKREKIQETGAESAETSTQTESAEEEVSDIDWKGIWEINPDVYAWITVPGTVIDYPILQHETDNTYYLNYNIDGSYGYPGCIYTENYNAKDFKDNNTVIYGHNMKAGTMFAGLHNFRDEEFFEKYDTVYIYTPEKTLEYRIFAAYVYDDRHLMLSFDFSNEEVYETYLESIFSRRDLTTLIREDVSVTKDDKIITLVTCMGSEADKRLLVQAVLME